MDILAHALWTGGAAVPLRRRLHGPLSLGWAIFWGVFPDVFSFALPAVVRIWWYVSGTTSSLLPQPNSAQHFSLAGLVLWVLWDSLGKPLVHGHELRFANPPVLLDLDEARRKRLTKDSG